MNSRGLANELLKNHDQAIADFTQAIKLDPRQATYHADRGYSYMRAGRHAEAWTDFDVAIRLDPNLANARRGRESRPGSNRTGPERGDGANRNGRRGPAVLVEQTRLEISPASDKSVMYPENLHRTSHPRPSRRSRNSAWGARSTPTKMRACKSPTTGRMKRVVTLMPRKPTISAPSNASRSPLCGKC